MNTKVGRYWIGESRAKIGNVSIVGQSISWDFSPTLTGPVTAETPLHLYMNGQRLLTCAVGDKQAEIPFYLSGLTGDLVLVIDGESPIYDGYTDVISATWEKVTDASSYIVYTDGVEGRKLGSQATSYTSQSLDSGTHTLAISSVDRYGNESVKSDEISTVVFDLPPAPQEFIFYVEADALWIKPVSNTIENSDCKLRIYSNFCIPTQTCLDTIEERYHWQEIDLATAVFPAALLDTHTLDTSSFLFRTALYKDGRETKNGAVQGINTNKISTPYSLHVQQLTDGTGSISIHFSYDWTKGKLCKTFEIRDIVSNTVLHTLTPKESSFVETYRVDRIATNLDTLEIVVAAISADGTEAVSTSYPISIDRTAPAIPTLRKGANY